MNDRLPDDTVQARMQGIRCEIDQDLQDVSARARSMVDWKHYVGAYPWVCLGAAAALGFLLVPKRPTASDAHPVAPSGPAKSDPPAANSAPAATHGWVDALVVAAAGIAVREAIAYLGKNAGKLLEMARHPETNHHDPNHTS
jgi:hypothetical protein